MNLAPKPKWLFRKNWSFCFCFFVLEKTGSKNSRLQFLYVLMKPRENAEVNAILVNLAPKSSDSAYFLEIFAAKQLEELDFLFVFFKKLLFPIL